MNGYPIVHTSSNPLRVKILKSNPEEMEAQIYNFLFMNKNYCEIHDIQYKRAENRCECLIAYKLKYQGEIVK